MNILLYLCDLGCEASWIKGAISLFCWTFCVPKYLHGQEGPLKLRFSSDYNRREEECVVSSRMRFFSTIGKIQTILSADQTNLLHDHCQNFCLPQLNPPHHNTQNILHPDFKIASQLFSFLKAFSCRFFYSMNEDSANEWEDDGCCVLSQKSWKMMMAPCSSYENCCIPMCITFGDASNIDH